MTRTEADRCAAAILAGFLVARLVFAALLGPGIDESYTIAISRTLSLSYFDHPPLHQWMAHFAALALGEGSATRLPLILLFAATGWIYYRFSCHLFGGRAPTVALFALNVTPFFFASAGSWVVPDGPLLFGLALAASAAARIFFPAPNEEAEPGCSGFSSGSALASPGFRNTAPRSAPRASRHSSFLRPDNGIGSDIPRPMRRPLWRWR